MGIIKICNKIIEYSFYALFLLVPLVFTSDAFELFEFNKMWLTFAITLIIAGCWITAMIIKKEFRIQRTPLDIPIAFFLLSQIISTIFSLDTHVSIWGYYSRFNGGLLSIISYIFLYYAFVTNFSRQELLTAGDAERAFDPSSGRGCAPSGGPRLVRRVGNAWGCEAAGPAISGATMVKRLLKISLASGLIVALWGLPSHFGYDPTCFLFRGTFDVSCWTEAFQPKVRIFSTLGQPDWLAAYLAILLPIAIFMFIKTMKFQAKPGKKFSIFNFQFSISNLFAICYCVATSSAYFLFSILFYVDLLFTRARSGFLAFWIANLAFWLAIFLTKALPKKTFIRYVLIFNFCFLLFTFFLGTPFSQLDKFTFSGIKSRLSQTTQKTLQNQGKTQPQAIGEMGGTDSGKIRLIVWRGAIDVFLHNPLIGSGVETFAFAYYKYRPEAHNLTSEWDYLYNKAHNEYLNYLATTGLFGLGSYLLIIGWFLFRSIENLKDQISKVKSTSQKSKPENKKILDLSFGFEFCVLSFALLASYLSILVSNFFGFSVVIVNLYFFLIPAFIFILNGMIDPQRVLVFPKRELEIKNFELRISRIQWTFITIFLFVIFYLLFNLFKFWQADKAYALGYNLDKVGEYQTAYTKLHEAVANRGDEPVFKDELSINNGVLAVALAYQKEATSAALVAQEAIKFSDQVVKAHPNNVVFWKTRVRLFYTLSQIDPQYLPQALSAIEQAHGLAPTDAKVAYNLGLLYGQNGDSKKAVETLKKAIKLKPDYREAFYALGLFYHDLAIDKNGRIIDSTLQKKAVETMRYILDRFSTEDAQVKQVLETWGEM